MGDALKKWLSDRMGKGPGRFHSRTSSEFGESVEVNCLSC